MYINYQQPLGNDQFIDFVDGQQVLRDFLHGFYNYVAPQMGQSSQKQAIRGLRPLLEIPFIDVKDQQVLAKELNDIINDMRTKGVPLDSSAVLQFEKMLRNANFQGAGNRAYFDKESPIGLGLELAELHKQKGTNTNQRLRYLLPEFLQKMPIETYDHKMKECQGKLYASMVEKMVSPELFVKQHTTEGTLFHGTSLAAGMNILRGGFVVSTNKVGTAAYGPGTYTGANYQTSSFYAGKEGIVLPLKFKESSSPNVISLNWIYNNQKDLLAEAKEKGFHERNTTDDEAIWALLRDRSQYAVDIVIGTSNILIVQNQETLDPNIELHILASWFEGNLKSNYNTENKISYAAFVELIVDLGADKSKITNIKDIIREIFPLPKKMVELLNHSDADENHVEIAAEYAQQHPNTMIEEKYTLIEYSLMNNHYQMVKRLLDQGAKINNLSQYLTFPNIERHVKGLLGNDHQELFKRLVEQDQNLSHAEHGLQTIITNLIDGLAYSETNVVRAIHLILEQPHFKPTQRDFETAVYKKLTDVAKCLLLEYHDDIYPEIPVVVKEAIFTNNPQLLKKLIAQEETANFQKYSRAAMELALKMSANENNEDIFKHLIEATSNPSETNQHGASILLATLCNYNSSPEMNSRYANIILEQSNFHPTVGDYHQARNQYPDIAERLLEEYSHDIHPGVPKEIIMAMMKNDSQMYDNIVEQFDDTANTEFNAETALQFALGYKTYGIAINILPRLDPDTTFAWETIMSTLSDMPIDLFNELLPKLNLETNPDYPNIMFSYTIGHYQRPDIAQAMSEYVQFKPNARDLLVAMQGGDTKIISNLLERRTIDLHDLLASPEKYIDRKYGYSIERFKQDVAKLDDIFAPYLAKSNPSADDTRRTITPAAHSSKKATTPSKESSQRADKDANPRDHKMGG